MHVDVCVRAQVQVSVAVLLDNFVTCSHQIDSEIEEERRRTDSAGALRGLERSPLEPLVIRLTKGFADGEDLSARLRSLFKVCVCVCVCCV